MKRLSEWMIEVMKLAGMVERTRMCYLGATCLRHVTIAVFL